MTTLTSAPTTVFRGPDDTTAPAPPEARGVPRDHVRMLVVEPDRVTDGHFLDIQAFLRAGDLLVVNTSATVAAEIDADRVGYGPVVLHVATPLDDGSWAVELRTAPDGARPVLDAVADDVVVIGDAVRLRLLEPYPRPRSSPTGVGNRLWRVEVTGTPDLGRFLTAWGRPIAYGYLDRPYDIEAYQTVFAREPGSAEMPSAGRPFTAELVTSLVTAGVGFAPVLLHTGVSSQDAGEAPQPERYAVSATTAAQVNTARAAGGRIVAVGTTATRAIESATGPDGIVRAARGWTELVISPERPVRVVDGLVTGWHNPEASHLLLVESVAGPELTQTAYDQAVARGYLWHEFGDSCLLLPGSTPR